MNYANYIHHCIDLARRGEYYVAPNPMVGAVLVRNTDELVLGEGWHERYGQAHAEVNCFRHAEEAHPEITDYSDCTLFVSLEPCSHYGKTPPCAELIIRKGVGRVVVGMRDPHDKVAGRGIQMLRDAGIEVVVGIEEEACRELNKRFVMLHEQHRPYVVLKWAQTADGYIDRVRQSAEEGGPLVISSPETKQIVHRMRAENMAILVGARTALLDNPKLKCTRWEGRNPIRVLLDRHRVVPRDYAIFSPDVETIVYSERTDWPYVLTDMAGRGIHSVLVEGGAQVLGHILETGIWDEIHVEVSSQTIGEGVAAPEIELPTDYETVGKNKLYTIVR